MLRGRPMTVWRRAEGPADSMGDPVCAWVPETVAGVLWGPARSERLDVNTSRSDGGARPDGTVDTIKACFPKDYTASLAGCRLEAYGRLWSVVGDPPAHLPHLAGGRWNRTVYARKVDG